jgi:hypothetical protein
MRQKELRNDQPDVMLFLPPVALSGNLRSLALFAFSETAKPPGCEDRRLCLHPPNRATPSIRHLHSCGRVSGLCLGSRAPTRKDNLRGSGNICVLNWSYRDFRPMLLSGDATDGRGELRRISPSLHHRCPQELSSLTKFDAIS